MSDINVTVTQEGAVAVSAAGGDSYNAVVGNGGAVDVSVGGVSPGNATIVSGTLTINSTTTLPAGSQAYVKNDAGTAYAAKLDIGIPAGPATSVVVGNTTTLESGNATVTGVTSNGTLTLAFGIPRGPAGLNGTNGINGTDGTNGTTPSFSVGNVSTLAAGSNATVNLTTANNGANVVLDFGLPRGEPGESGSSANLTLSNATPSALGTASAGTSNLPSRSDHVHELPVIAWGNLSGVPSNFPTNTSLVSGLSAGYAAINHAHDYVTAVNNLTGGLTLTPGANVTITPSGGSTLTIDAAPATPLADSAPQSLGVPAPGVSVEAARGDHVHQMPTASDVGALDSNSSIDGGLYVGYVPQNTITITQQPTEQTAANGTASFSVAATSSPGGTLSYQWQKQDGGAGEFVTLSGETSATLLLTGLLHQVDGGDKYRVIVSATNASSVTSNSVLLTVPPNLITITSQPTSQTASSGTASFSLSASVSPSGAPSYQWQRKESTSDGASWSAAIDPSDDSWTAIAYGGGTFVATASFSNKVAVSTDFGASWAVQSLASTATYQAGVCYGNGIFVAVTYGDPYAHTSPDGVTWTQRSLPADRLWYSVVYGNGTFVAVSYSGGTAATSPDGVTWTERTLPAAVGWISVAYGGGLFVAVATNSGEAATSTDGATWTQRSLPATAAWNSVTYGRGRFVAIAGGSSIAATSTDGVNWTQRVLPAVKEWKAVAYGGGMFVAVGLFGAVATSPDGEIWSPVQAVGSRVGIAYGGGTFISASSAGMSRSGPPLAFYDINGATSSSLALSGLSNDTDDGDQYRAVVSAAGALPVTSNVATLTVA